MKQTPKPALKRVMSGYKKPASFLDRKMPDCVNYITAKNYFFKISYTTAKRFKQILKRINAIEGSN